MNDEDPRKSYWNNKYVEYWQARVGEAGVGKSSVLKGDERTEDDGVYERIFSEVPFNEGNILDVGCAWGRMFSIYESMGLMISGVDISQRMIELAKEEWGGEASINELYESSAEQLPFKDEAFDNLVCLATFDATFQHQALTEFLRITKEGARIYVTGKNCHYSANDEPAIAAEIGARKKGHPNFFTNVHDMIMQLSSQGHKLVKSYFFVKRGDFSSMTYVEEIPEIFYEYMIIFERGKTFKTLSPFSGRYSDTFRSLGL